MELQKLNVKFFADAGHEIPLARFIDIFHGWIQNTDGDYHDVADYSHMQNGPGIVLIARDANISIDETGNRRGLLFNRKTDLSGSNQEKLQSVFRSALGCCRKLENEAPLGGKLRFSAREALVTINDRLIGTNNDADFAALKAEVEPWANRVFPNADLRFDRDDDPRQRLHVAIKASSDVDLNSLSSNLQRE